MIKVVSPYSIVSAPTLSSQDTSISKVYIKCWQGALPWSGGDGVDGGVGCLVCLTDPIHYTKLGQLSPAIHRPEVLNFSYIP